MWLACVACWPGCGARDDTPRTPQQIDAERESLPALYLTKSGREIIAPRNPERAIANRGELAYAAWACRNPNCPGEKNGDRPFLFVWPNPLAELNADGTLGRREQKPNEDYVDLLRAMNIPETPTCPACLQQRNVAKESTAQRNQYFTWCEEFVLPETAARLKELDEEHRRRIEYVKKLRSGGK